MSQGLCMYDSELRLILCNRRYLELSGVSAEMVRPGMTLGELLGVSVKRGNYDPADGDRIIAERVSIARSREERILRQLHLSGRVIEIAHRHLTDTAGRAGGCGRRRPGRAARTPQSATGGRRPRWPGGSGRFRR